jgi:hypothetical protein
MEINCPICGDFHDFKRLLICDYLFTNVINKRLNYKVDLMGGDGSS